MPRRIEEVGLLLGIALVSACVSEFEDPELDDFRVAKDEEGRALQSPSGGGTYLGNGLEDPDVSGLDPAYGLNTGQGLSAANGLLTTDEGRTLAGYVVECALPEGDTISKTVAGHSVQLHGLLGLAPEWKTGACDQDCQEWVTACLLARTNVSGQSVTLWITGDHPNLGLGLSDDYPLFEASFYGNLFLDPDAAYVCRGDYDFVATMESGRVCTSPNPGDCGFTVYSSCTTLERCVMVDGLFPTDCAEGNGATGARYHSITTFLADPNG